MAPSPKHTFFAFLLGVLALHCGGASDGVAAPPAAPVPDTSTPNDSTGNATPTPPRDDDGPAPAPPSIGKHLWERVVDDDNSPFFAIGSVGGTTMPDGDVIVTYALRGTTTSLGGTPQEGPGLLVARVARDNTTVRWTKLFPAKSGIRVFDAVAGDDDQVFLAGQAESASLELGTTAIAQKAAFVARLSGATGAVMWAHEVSAPMSYSTMRSITTRGLGPIVIAGSYGGGTLTYPGPDNTTFTREIDDGVRSAFVFEIDRATGRAIWGRTFHAGVLGVTPAVDLTSNGDVELALSAHGTVTSDSGPFVVLPGNDRFSVLTRLAAANGAESALVTRKFGTAFGVLRVRALPNGDVIYGGDVRGPTDIGPLASRPTNDVFVMKTNAAHQEAWTTFVMGKGDGTEKTEGFVDVDVDAWGRVLLSAYSQSDGAFVGTTAVSGARTGQATTYYGIVAKLDSSGAALWTRGLSAGADANVFPTRARYAGDGDVIVSAVFGDQADFGGGMTSADSHERGIVVRWSP